QTGAIQSAAGDATEAIEQVNSIIAEMSGIAARVAAAVEEQNAAVATIAEGVNRASTEARSGAEAMTRVAGASAGARSTADDVKALAEALAADAEGLDAEVRRFLSEVRAASAANCQERRDSRTEAGTAETSVSRAQRVDPCT